MSGAAFLTLAQTAVALGVSASGLRPLGRRQIVLELVDADGVGHPVVLQGDTRQGGRARDYVRDLLRP